MTKTSAQKPASWLRPCREGKKGILLYVDPQVAAGVRIIAGVHGQSMQEYLAGLVERDVSAKQSTQLKSTIREITARANTALRSIVPRQHTPRLSTPSR